MIALICISISLFLFVVAEYPVPTPANERYDVHGWLILPTEQNNPKSNQVEAYFSHHVPEFYISSPHNFHIMLKGYLEPISPTNNINDIVSFNIPLPPTNWLNGYTYSFTPPTAFSLNNLLNGDITSFNGVYYNGTFDALYPREPLSIAKLNIEQIITANYLNETNTDMYSNLQYLIYPISSNSNHYYLSHDIHTNPDFYHTVEGTIDCSDKLVNLKAGMKISIPNILNIVTNRLKINDLYDSIILNNQFSKCQLTIIQDIHCKVGPGFMTSC